MKAILRATLAAAVAAGVFSALLSRLGRESRITTNEQVLNDLRRASR